MRRGLRGAPSLRSKGGAFGPAARTSYGQRSRGLRGAPSLRSKGGSFGPAARISYGQRSVSRGFPGAPSLRSKGGSFGPAPRTLHAQRTQALLRARTPALHHLQLLSPPAAPRLGPLAKLVREDSE